MQQPPGYVKSGNDLILLTEIIQEMQEMKEGLANTFKMKDMGELCFCLGVNFELNEFLYARSTT